MTETSRRPTKPLSASSSVSDLSFEDVRLEEASKVSSNRTGTERSASVGLPAAKAPLRRSESPFAAAEQSEDKHADQQESLVEEISWRGAPPPAAQAVSVDPAALRENLAALAGQAASTAGQAATTLSDATLAASSTVMLSSVRGREILMEKLSKQIPPQAGSWLTGGLNNWSVGFTDRVHTGFNAVQHFWANADASMKTAREENLIQEPQDSEEVRALFEIGMEEELMETFVCHLFQHYMCRDNDFTDAKQVTFPGRLYMTGRHICFHCEPTPHFKIPLKSVQKIEKSTEAGQDVVKLQLDANRRLMFGGFKAMDMDNFLALAWHFTSNSN